MKGDGIGGNDEFLIGIELDELFNILVCLILVVLSGLKFHGNDRFVLFKDKIDVMLFFVGEPTVFKENLSYLFQEVPVFQTLIAFTLNLETDLK